MIPSRHSLTPAVALNSPNQWSGSSTPALSLAYRIIRCFRAELPETENIRFKLSRTLSAHHAAIEEIYSSSRRTWRLKYTRDVIVANCNRVGFS